jgi:hypothetical protein
VVAAWIQNQGHHEAALRPEGAWIRLLGCGKTAAPRLMQSFFDHFSLNELLQAQDAHGRKALDMATPGCKTVLESMLCVRLLRSLPPRDL